MRGWVSPFIKLVIFLVITAIATYILGATIANSSFGSTTTYTADFSDVTGLQLGDDVRISGVRVGTVTDIKIEQGSKEQHYAGYAQVSFTVQKSDPLPASTEVNLRYRNLVGQRYLDVQQGAGDPNDLLKDGDTICGGPDPTNCPNTHPAVDLTVLFNGFAPLVKGLSAPAINQLSFEVIQTLQGEGGALESLLGTVADLTNSLADKDQVIGDVITNLTGVLTAVGERDNELNDLIIQLKNFFTGLAQDRHTIGNAIDGINRLANSTADLLTHVRGPFAQDVKSITGLVDQLNQNSSTLKFVIRQLPPTVGALIRTASYGSWFNFYLCEASGTLVLPGNIKKEINIASNGAARCNS
ncbi:MAG: phospholipid/cholesterol/gamma-HCH transport system substrate-binding protein [Pseudonocardiales bacterium]|jgi:phospholipid/cholesterol/gamma-HCH transport system substrate-binding protein|nr:phospholipid/cholesterol/gamma-HCH transport system substrate-binding protein [Pseudonocardiales bacterium]